MVSAQKPNPISLALAEASRRAILEHLRLGQRSVSEIIAATGLKQPNVSNHLAKMRASGIVRAERCGRMVYYSLANPVADALMRLHEATFDSLSQDTDSPNLETFPTDATPQELALQVCSSQFLLGLLSGEEERVDGIVNQMLEKRVSLQDIYVRVFQPALNEIGSQYEEGRVDEAQEHLATEITERAMSRVSQFYSPVIRANRKATLGCVAGNWHSLGLRMIGDALKQLGWEVVFLGANVPTASLVKMVETVRPHLVIISCSLDEQEEELKRALAQLQVLKSRANPSFRVVVGGHLFSSRPELQRTIAADFFPTDLNHFLRELPSLI